MALAFARKIAIRYLFSRRKEAFISIITVISILGVAIGVMVINVTMAIMTGFEYELRQKIVDAESHIVVRALGGRISEWREVGEVIRKNPEVESVDAFTYSQALLRTSG